jgi:hypothetical protein
VRRVIEVMLEEEQPCISVESTGCAAATTIARELLCPRLLDIRRHGVTILFQVHACSHAAHEDSGILGPVSASGAGSR